MAPRRKKDQPLLPNEEFQEAILHPLRRRILSTLAAGGKMTQKELADQVDAAPASVRHHLLKLKKVGLVKDAGTRPGPKAITEKLFRTARGKGEIKVKLLNSMEGKRHRQMIRDEIIEDHRVGYRIAEGEDRFIGGSAHPLTATAGQLQALTLDLGKTVDKFRRSLKRGKKEKGQKEEFGVLHISFCPKRGPEKRAWKEACVVLSPKKEQ